MLSSILTLINHAPPTAIRINTRTFQHLGIFLGYSILQLLEYGVRCIISQTVSFQDFLARRIADLKHVMRSTSQENDSSQVEEGNVQNDSQIIEISQEPTGKNCNDCDGRIQALEEEVREIRTKMEVSQRSEK